ncbi:MAG: hypothetical protein JSW73_03420 [Candidatus Woesearchaeota archaeon]|nr:MAG: hypothetical protein JSW73_03420 [Candidatus Woesearchaeota archaeon]
MEKTLDNIVNKIKFAGKLIVDYPEFLIEKSAKSEREGLYTIAIPAAVITEGCIYGAITSALANPNLGGIITLDTIGFRTLESVLPLLRKTLRYKPYFNVNSSKTY